MILWYIVEPFPLWKWVVFNSIQVTNYWFTLHCALRLLYQQAQTFSPNIQGILDQNVTISLMKMIMFNSIQVINYWFTLHCALRLLYQQAQTFSLNIWGISDQNVTIYKQKSLKKMKNIKQIYRYVLMKQLIIQILYNILINNKQRTCKLRFL